MANNVGVTNRGFEYLCQYMTGTATTAQYTYPTYIGWGTVNQSNATLANFPASNTCWTYVGPCAEAAEARVAGTPTTANNSQGNSAVTFQLTGTMTCTQSGGENIGESFIAFNTAPSGKGQAVVGVGASFLPSATALTVTSVANLPSAPFQLQAYNETLNVSAITGTVLTVDAGNTA